MVGWMSRWTWVWVNSGSWWWTGKPDVLPSMGSQEVRHDWATELNWQNHGLVRLQSSWTQIAGGNAKWCSPSKQVGSFFKHKCTSSFTSYMKTWKHKWKSLSCVQLFVTPWTIQSKEFSRPEYWSGVAFPFSPGSSQPRDWTQVSYIVDRLFTSWVTRETHMKTCVHVKTCTCLILVVYSSCIHNHQNSFQQVDG